MYYAILSVHTSSETGRRCILKKLLKALFGLIVLVGAVASILLLCEDSNADDRYVTIYDDANGEN